MIPTQDDAGDNATTGDGATASDAATTTSDQQPTAVATPAFPVVGIGASAGGLAAFEAFFSGMPADTDPGMAFVLVQHLAPDHKSLLTELVRRYTRMQVFEVEDGMRVAPNCAYIIPPGRDMAFLNGTLQLLEPSAPRGQRMPIDFFFRSLAQDQHERAIGIVLSGTASDGTLGIRAIKAEGGMVMAQTPSTTEYDGMPTSAIATGLVDYELAPAAMPAHLIAYVSHAFAPGAQAPPVPAREESALKKVFILLRAQTGHDFSQYKPSTVQRRVERRMAVHQIEAIGGYVKYLQQSPAEIEALFRDLLIGVTSFFRDSEAFDALERVGLPRLLAGKAPGEELRVWVAGCSTGEEAYSLAILLSEHLATLNQRYPVHVFATDIDSRSIATARAALYPASIAQDVSPERLARFFTLEPGGGAYRLNKSIRDMVIFSEQDIIKDPPFSQLDLLSCRNLLIYLSAQLQARLIPLFHYALRAGGTLLLGTSETVGDHGDLFAPLDRAGKLYQRLGDARAGRHASLSRFVAARAAATPRAPQAQAGHRAPAKLSLRELTERTLLQHAALAAALVTDRGDVLYLHGRTGMYFEPAPGEAGVSNLHKMAREGLLQELGAALRKAARTGESVRARRLRVKTNGDFTRVDLTVQPVALGAAAPDSAAPESAAAGGAAPDSAAPEAPAYLVILAPSAPEPQSGSAAAPPEPSAEMTARVAELEQALRAKDEYLEATNEQLETSNEELKSSNEEMQSVNEELQATNEELETSKEELQSVNEELATVNGELQAKVVDLSRTNNDMSNLLAGTGIGTVFVDHRLRILRFTPTATQIINLIPSDRGRPIGHVVTNLVGYERLVADAQAVLDTLIPVDRRVQTSEGSWYAMRILPYRTLDNVIEGAVLTFVEITEAVQAQEALRKANELLRLAVVVRDAHDAITVQDLDGRILAWNPGAVRAYGWTEAEALAMNVRDRIPEALREDALARVHELSLARKLEPIQTQRLTKAGAVVEVWLTSTALVDESGRMYAIATTERTSELAPTRTPKDARDHRG